MLSNRDRNLPEDVVIEILSRLPVKSLLRFKCVCRYWCTLIKSPDFISKHFNQENNNGHLLVHHYISDIDRYAISLFRDETLSGIPPLHENLDHLQIPECMGDVVGPIDGIFLVYTWYSDGDRMALWNPAMREFRRLHVLEPIFPPNFHAIVNVVGFGLDPLTRDYKIIWIRDFYEAIGDESGDDIDYPYYVVAVYTLGKDSWRHFDLLTIPTGGFIYNSLCDTCINGAYYWLCAVGNANQYRILSFDLRLEEFREIEVPANTGYIWGSLSLYNGSIGLFFCQSDVTMERVIDIWVMEEKGCWIKLVTVRPFPEFSRPCGFWKEKELLFESRTNELVLFNHETHEIRNLEMYGCGSFLGLWAVCYKESLVSLFGQNDEDGRRDYQLSDAVHDFFITSCR
ncbi:F-box/kelch-repeat protein At3g06240-like isoform X1 [Camellia sinensis]|uniref:F-box/kelch-repeat protein At3g06240-like isoform X1 n=1 Tax=Camellia sinensis TaxID=4442 RepID=UPI001035A1E4|nr:F-box/kelch-repeat protein At3g06240-like isoform X1 [Camellia sinensis]XP_028083970.1 F-box/kelch-repeat protein At3g06240-like isoform X1 [Camellia sinensis]XP_028083971.1 F-box/kelch-repeat protein At3g06240-like isoform X1 [Camellia sinensis]XP_028083972.1 F-box/kelch-repeat protein At3g06240-like isoform X1 [Camellia sinensis]XP_028083973.1 F-box/kelch-repeat protein At3g06240-like isoform X1 [Camellia sinensis]XP_028083974.1 F-box/kelch-repeat protein At3g06240-like isoform X1 [Camell